MSAQAWFGLFCVVAWIPIAAYGHWGPQRKPAPAPAPARKRSSNDAGDVVAGLLALPFVLAGALLVLAVYLSPLLILLWLVAH